MSILSKATRPEREPLIATIVGTAGSGKTSLAATFPNAILIRTQGEALPRDLANPPLSMPELQTAQELWDIIKALLNDPHDFKTLIVDSVTGLETLFVEDVLAQEKDAGGKARGIIQALGGYGAGPAAVTSSHMRMRKGAELLRKRRGMDIIFVAHADVMDITLPDSDPFSQYTLRLPKKSVSPYVDQVDLVGFLKQDRIVRGAVEAKDNRPGKAGRAVTTGDRVLTCVMSPSSVAKNRLGITEDLEVVHGVNPLADWMGTAKPTNAKRSAPAPVETDEDDVAEAAMDAYEGDDK